MKIFFASFTAIILVCSYACSGPVKQVVETDLPGTLTEEVVSAFNSGDFKKVTDLCSDDAVVISCGWRMCGRDSVASGMKYLLAHSSDLSITPGTGKESPDNIFVSGLMIFRWKNESYSATAKGMMNIIWKKEAGNKWKITFLQEDHGDIPEK
ncbi:MAG TPA: nuclear transport factor 2 family protein [Bacteroidales bacterium]|nr:nuclear transport factor 2 family protein [Bacteroidales bacterium]